MSYSSTISPPSSKVVCTFRRPPDTTDVLWPPARSMAGPRRCPGGPGAACACARVCNAPGRRGWWGGQRVVGPWAGRARLVHSEIRRPLRPQDLP